MPQLDQLTKAQREQLKVIARRYGLTERQCFEQLQLKALHRLETNQATKRPH